MVPISDTLPPKPTVEFWMTSTARLARASKISMWYPNSQSSDLSSQPFVLIDHSFHF